MIKECLFIASIHIFSLVSKPDHQTLILGSFQTCCFFQCPIEGELYVSSVWIHVRGQLHCLGPGEEYLVDLARVSSLKLVVPRSRCYEFNRSHNFTSGLAIGFNCLHIQILMNPFPDCEPLGLTMIPEGKSVFGEGPRMPRSCI